MKQALGGTEDRTASLEWRDINEGFTKEVKKIGGFDFHSREPSISNAVRLSSRMKPGSQRVC